MIKIPPEEAYSFDDVMLIPNYSDVLPQDVNINTRLTKNLALNIHQDISCGASEVHIVTRDKSDMEKAKKIVDKDAELKKYGDRIIFHPISDFFS